ncbi:hemophore-related protein [Mycolicibacterium moriokaense]|nr:hemophore-related protein [Mycolicibacterium moriokaense]
MIKRSLMRVVVPVGGLALSLSAGLGVASADPDYGPMVDSPCTYDQAITALRTDSPMAVQYMDKFPANYQFLKVFLSSPRDERVNLLNQIKGNPGANLALPIFQQTLTGCTKY